MTVNDIKCRYNISATTSSFGNVKNTLACFSCSSKLHKVSTNFWCIMSHHWSPRHQEHKWHTWVCSHKLGNKRHSIHVRNRRCHERETADLDVICQNLKAKTLKYGFKKAIARNWAQNDGSMWKFAHLLNNCANMAEIKVPIGNVFGPNAVTSGKITLGKEIQPENFL